MPLLPVLQIGTKDRVVQMLRPRGQGRGTQCMERPHIGREGVAVVDRLRPSCRRISLPVLRASEQ